MLVLRLTQPRLASISIWRYGPPLNAAFSKRPEGQINCTPLHVVISAVEPYFRLGLKYLIPLKKVNLWYINYPTILIACIAYSSTYIQGPDMGKCRPGASRKVPPPPHSQWRNQRFEPGGGFFWSGPVSHRVGMQ